MPLGQVAAGLEAREVHREQAESRLVEGGVDHATLAGAFALQQPADAAERGPHRAAQIEHGGADAHARPVRIAVDREQPGERLHHRLVAAVFLHGALRPERRERAVDEARIALGQGAAAEPECVHHAGAQVVDQHVAALDVVLDPGDVVGRLEIERDAALVDVEALEGRRGVLPERRAPGARVVAPLRPLDLEHVRPEHRQDVAGIGAGDVVGEFHDLHAGQRQHGRSSEMGLRPWCSGCPTLSPFRELQRAQAHRHGQRARPCSAPVNLSG